MIDGFRFQTMDRGLARQIRTRIPFGQPIDDLTGVFLEDTRKAYDRKLRFAIVNDMYISCRGSLHKFHKGHNYDNFFYDEVSEAIHELCSEYQFNPKLCFLKHIEVGVNIRLSVSVNHFIKSLRCFDNLPLSHWPSYDTWNFSGKQLRRDRYRVKFYNKGLQIGRDNLNLLRFEYRTLRMADIQKTGIKTLYDLTDKCKYQLLVSLLQKASEKVILFDETIDIESVNDIEEKYLLRMLSDNTSWERKHFNNRPARISKINQCQQMMLGKANRDILREFQDMVDYKTSLLYHS